MVPVVVRLEEAGVCGCGAVVATGERAGTTGQPGVVVCLSCLTAFSADSADLADSSNSADSADSTELEQPGSGSEALDDLVRTVPEPVAVVIPADWGPASPSSLPSWQRAAGVAVALPPAAPLSPRPVDSAPVVAVQISPSGAPLDAAPLPQTQPASEAEAHTAQPAEVEAEPRAVLAAAVSATVVEPVPTEQPLPVVVAVSAEAVAMAPPSHRRRTFLPPGLLALRSSRGREPGSSGRSDAATRAFLESAARAGILSLHDRRMPGRRGRIPHLAFGAGGVYVIDVVLARNASVAVLPVDELEPEKQQLVVDGHPLTATVTATRARVDVVRTLLDEVELTTVPVIGVMCFLDAALPAGAALAIEGIRVVGRAALPTLVDSEGVLDLEHRETLLEYLTERLPA